jgi:hypothetical protein
MKKASLKKKTRWFSKVHWKRVHYVQISEFSEETTAAGEVVFLYSVLKTANKYYLRNNANTWKRNIPFGQRILLESWTDPLDLIY